MNVLHIYKTAEPFTLGGIETVLKNLSEETAKLGVKNRILVMHSGNKLIRHRFLGGVVIALPYRFFLLSMPLSLSYFQAFNRLRKWADILHYHAPFPMQDLMHLIYKVQQPALVSYHSDVVKQKRVLKLYRPLLQRFLGRVQKIVVASEAYRQSSEELQQHADRTAVIPYGLQSNHPLPMHEDLTTAGLTPGYFLYLGAFRYYKGLDFLLAAAETTGLPLVLAGFGSAVEYRDRIDSLPNVRLFEGVTEAEKYQLIENAQAFILPSHLRSEAFGIVLLEAARQAKPMITCEIGTATSWINQHQKTGLVVPPADAPALAEAMLELQNSPERRAQWGIYARERFQHLFLAEKMAHSYFQLYQQLNSIEKHA